MKTLRFSRVSILRACLLNVLLLVFFSVNIFSQPKRNIDSLKQVIKNNLSDSSVAQAYNGWGKQLLLNHPDSALNKFQKARLISEYALNNSSVSPDAIIKYKSLLSTSLNNIGYCYFLRIKLDDALNYYYKSLKLNEEIKDKNAIANSVMNIGVIYCYYLKDNTNALKNFQRGLSLCMETKNREGEATALHNIAAVYQQEGDTVTALNYYFKSIDIRKSLNDKNGIAGVYNNIAAIYEKKGDLEKALDYYSKSLELRKELNDQQMIAYSVTHIASIYFAQGKTEKARQLAEESLQIGKQKNYTDVIRITSLLLQKILASEGRWKEAYQMFLLYDQVKDSMKIKESRDNAAISQAKYEFEKRTVADSLKYSSAQREKDLEIREQKNIRNSIIAITLLLLITGLLLFNRFRVGLRNKQNELQITTLETEQKLLRAQMNPHFIYNSLNSIQSLILENKPRQAREYLVTFSRLTRAVLEQTKKKTISLTKEIETLRLYLEMEKLRFNDKFDYEIIKVVNVDSENIFIPPLIIQPFVENSIIHGISHKENKGKITIEFRKDNGTLKCIVQDDGVGRKRAQELNSFKSIPGLSVATQLAQTRLQLMNKKGEESLPIFITDLTDEAGNALGTKTEISIPLSSAYD